MKKVLTVVGILTLLVLIAMPMTAQTVQVPQVQVGTFASTASNLGTGTGAREMTVAISFPKPFKEKPSVVVGITMLDAIGTVNTRVSVVADGVSRDGFTAVIKTWGDSKVNGVQGSWVAVAPVTVKVSK
jgi:hypothetical protein